MNALTNIETSLTMSSREIAELTGKSHKNVLADIRGMLKGLGITSADFSAHIKTSMPNGGSRKQPAFNLPKRETLILVSGYDVLMRARIIDRWQELEGREQSPQHSIPQTRAEALRLAADLEEQTDKVPRLSGWFI